MMSNLTDSSAKNTGKIATLVDLLRVRAKTQPDKKAYIFLADGENESDSLTYAELDQKARVLASHLQSRYQVGERALLLYPAGLDFVVAFFGCIYAGIIAIPAFPPTRNQKLSRLQSVVANAAATIALATESILENIQKHFEQTPDLAQLDWLATDTPFEGEAEQWVNPELDSDCLCFLQYTSGSTGNPKGVMVSHGNLLHNSEYLKTAFQLDENSVSVTWLPSFHDMGLIDGVLQPIYSGFLGVLMPPITFLQKPIRWLQAISRYRATHSGGPNFGYDLCVSKIDPQALETLDLSCWSSAYNGAEPIRQDTLDRFAQTFNVWGFKPEFFYPCYGMAEATLMVSGGKISDRPNYLEVKTEELAQNQAFEVNPSETNKTTTFVGCGQAWLETQVTIVDPSTLQECREGQIGEIWVSGGSVAQGYWNQPKLTKATFQARLKGSKAHHLRTGDLGFLKDGELYITGRFKDLIIIRGRNFYPQDIELSVSESHCALRSNATAAFSVEIEGEERLVIVQELERTHLRKFDLDEVVTAIRSAVSQSHELPVHAIVLLKPGHILKTSSGKIQRQACRTAYLEKTLEVVDQWELDSSANKAMVAQSLILEQSLQICTQEAVQTWLSQWLAQRLDIDPTLINPTKAFADYGMDSLMGIELVEAIEHELGKEMELDAAIAWNFPTIGSLSQYLANKLDSNPISSSELVDPISDSLEQLTNTLEDLDALSEKELVELLLEEITLAQQHTR